MSKITAAHILRVSFGVLTLSSLALVGVIWFSGSTETNQSLTNGLRVLVTMDTGAIEGTQAPEEKPDDKKEAKPDTAADKKPDAAPADATSPAVKTDKPTEKPAEKPTEKPADKLSEKAPDALESKPADDASSKSEKKAPHATTPTPVVAASSSATASLGTAEVPLANVNEDLVERAGPGLLPKVGPDGLKPWRFYAKTYAHKGHLPTIAIIVSGLGQNKSTTDMAVRLPQNFSLSFTPYAKDFTIWVNSARVNGHEVLVDLPMEPSNFPAADPGPYGLLVGKGNQVNISRLEWLMSRGQGYVGFVTPQNEVYSSEPDGFKMLLEELGKRGLSLVMGHEPAKSDTSEMLETSKTVHAVGDLLIDEELSASSIQARLLSLEKLASKRGYAVGIAQAYPLTIQQLSAWSEQVAKDGFEIVPVTFVIGLKFPG